MALAMGSNSKLGVGLETMYGEPAAIGHWIDAENESIKLTAPSVMYKGFRGKGRLLSNARQGNKSTGGTISVGLFSRGLLWAWEAALGKRTSSLVNGGTAAYKHLFNLDNELKSFTAEVDRDIEVFQYPGLKISSLQLSGSQNNYWKLQLTTIGNGVEDYPAASADSWPQDNFTYMFHDMELRIGNVVIPSKEFSLNLNNKFVEDRYGTEKTRFELPFASREITGSLKMDFEEIGLEEYRKFVNAQASQLVLTLTGDLIEGTTKEMIKITLPQIRYTGDTPVIDKAEALSQSLPFDVLGLTGNDEMTVEIVNKESLT